MQGKAATILIAVVVILLGIIGFALIFNNGKIAFPGTSEKASISGTFDINGVIPDDATITLSQKQVGSGEGVSIFSSGVPIGDGDSWSYNEAQSGKSYIIKAEVIVDGEVVATSNPLGVTAPATEEVITINLPAEDRTGNAVISGNIAVNGYIPQGSTITIKGKRLGAANYTTVASGLTGQSRQFMSYSTAVPGVLYQVIGELIGPNGSVIGTSDILNIAAPAVNEKLMINSSAQAPAPTGTPAPTGSGSTSTGNAVISGSINFNGAAPANSRIVIFAQAAGASSNQVVVNNVAPVNGTTWSWNGAQASTWYTMVAVLKQAQANGTDKDIADSQTVQIAAPASNVVFNINSGMSLSAPGGNITVTCNSFNNVSNQWQATVNYQTVNGAQSYWMQVGTTSGGSSVANNVQNAQSNVTSQTMGGLTLNNSTTYYAQYAYANVPNVPANGSQYSGFSPSVPIQCNP